MSVMNRLFVAAFNAVIGVKDVPFATHSAVRWCWYQNWIHAHNTDHFKSQSKFWNRILFISKSFIYSIRMKYPHRLLHTLTCSKQNLRMIQNHVIKWTENCAKHGNVDKQRKTRSVSHIILFKYCGIMFIIRYNWLLFLHTITQFISINTLLFTHSIRQCIMWYKPRAHTTMETHFVYF